MTFKLIRTYFRSFFPLTKHFFQIVLSGNRNTDLKIKVSKSNLKSGVFSTGKFTIDTRNVMFLSINGIILPIFGDQSFTIDIPLTSGSLKFKALGIFSSKEEEFVVNAGRSVELTTIKLPKTLKRNSSVRKLRLPQLRVPLGVNPAKFDSCNKMSVRNAQIKTLIKTHSVNEIELRFDLQLLEINSLKDLK